MLNTLQRYRARKLEDQTELGFTLIELLIVIVVLGILAAVTVFALTGVTGKSAVSACNSDASSVNTAVQAYLAQNPSATTVTYANLTSPIQYLQAQPSSSHYTITISGTSVMVATTAAPTAVAYISGTPPTIQASACATAA